MGITVNDKSQVQKFRQAAKELKTDLNEDRFKKVVRKVAEATEPPADENPKTEEPQDES